MIFFIGLLLAPLGGLAGALMIAAVSAIAAPDHLPSDFLRTMAFFGVTIGGLLAAPTTVAVLPATHFLLTRNDRRGLTISTVAGCLSGGATMLAASLLARGADAALQPRGLMFLMFIGALSGAACGALLDAILGLRARACADATR